MSEAPGRSWRGNALRLSLACDLAEVLPAIRAVRGFLAEQGLSEKELAACELALAEACNNAIDYAADAAKAQPVEVEAICNTSGVELRVNDHTPGFDWPQLKPGRSEEHTSELQSPMYLVCRLLLEKKKLTIIKTTNQMTT